MTSLRTAALVVVVTSLVLAGCSAGPLGDGGTDTGGEAGQPDAATVKADALEAMDETDTYAVTSSEERTVESQFEQELTVEGAKVVDRDQRRVQVNQTTRSGGRSVLVETYLVDRTLYQRSDAFVRQYDSEWIKVDVSENFSSTWTVIDTLERHERVLNISEVRLNDTVTENGTEYHVLVAEPDPGDLEVLLAEQLSGPSAQLDADDVEVHDARFEFRIDAETDRPERVSGRLNSSYTVQGQTVDLNQSFEFRYERYGAPTEVALPEGADDAVAVGENGRIRATDGRVAATGAVTGVV